MHDRDNRIRRGVSLIELTVVIAVFAVLAAALTPVVSSTIGRSKVQRARIDTCAIRDAVLNMLNDTNALGIVCDGQEQRGYQNPDFPFDLTADMQPTASLACISR